MKKILIIPLLAMALFLFNNDDTASAQLLIGDGQPTLESSFGDKKNTTLSRAEIQRMLDELGAKYDVGEPFSDADAATLMKLSKLLNQKTDEVTAQATYYFGDIGENGAHWVAVDGVCELSAWNPLNINYKCNASARGNKSTITLEITNVGYGALGTNLIGKIYEKTFRTSGRDRIAISGAKDSYAGVPVVHNMTLSATSTYNGTKLIASQTK